MDQNKVKSEDPKVLLILAKDGKLRVPGCCVAGLSVLFTAKVSYADKETTLR